MPPRRALLGALVTPAVTNKAQPVKVADPMNRINEKQLFSAYFLHAKLPAKMLGLVKRQILRGREVPALLGSSSQAWRQCPETDSKMTLALYILDALVTYDSVTTKKTA